MLGGLAHGETLEQAVSSALAEHPSIDVASASYKAAQEEKEIQSSNYYPELEASVTAGRVYQDNATSRGLSVDRGAAYSNYGEGALALRQTIFDSGETKNKVQAADARMKSQEINITDTQERICLRIVMAYLDVMRSREAIKLLEEHKVKIKDYESRIRSQVEEGLADESEIQQAMDVVTILDGIKADYEGQNLSAISDYSEAVGHEPDQEMVKPLDISALLPADMPKAVEMALSAHPAIIAAQKESDATSKEIEVQRAGFFPDVTGELSYMKSDKKDVIGGEVEDGRAVVRMNWNFSTGGKQISAVNQAKYQHAQASAKIEELKRQVERDVYKSYAEYHTYARKLDLSKERVKANSKMVSTYQTQFEGSKTSLLNLMKVESQMYSTRLDAMNNEFGLLRAAYTVMASMGRLKSVLVASQTAGSGDAEK